MRSTRGVKKERLGFFGSAGNWTPIYTELKESDAYRVLTPTERLILMDMIRVSHRASANDYEILNQGFEYTWTLCLEIVAEATFHRARKRICDMGFYEFPPGIQSMRPAAPTRFVPSRNWVKYVPTKGEERRIAKHNRTKKKRTREKQRRRSRFHSQVGYQENKKSTSKLGRNARGDKPILEEADRQRKRIEHELAEGTLRPKLGEEGIDAALLEFMGHQAASSVKASTIQGYKDGLKKWRAYLNTTDARRLKDITPPLIVGYVKSQNGKAPDTISGDLTRLQRIFRHFVDREAIAVNPFKHPSVKEVWPQSVKHERCFTDAQLSHFMEEARRPCRSPQWQDYVDFLTLLPESGLRLGEALHLRWCDIAFGNEEGSYLRVQPWGEWSPKTRKSVRNIPLSPTVEEMLRTRLRAQSDVDPKACIFPANWTKRSVCQHFNRVLKRACMHERDERDQKLRVHSFRHYYASVLVRSSVDPATVRWPEHSRVHDSSGAHRFPAEKESFASTR